MDGDKKNELESQNKEKEDKLGNVCCMQEVSKIMKELDLENTSFTSAEAEGIQLKIPEADPPTQVVASTIPKVFPARPTCDVIISKYDYGQTLEVVNVFIQIPGIGSDSKDKISLTATEDSFKFQVTGFNNKNWKLQVLNLAQDIIPADVHFLAENDTVTLVLPKKIHGKWESLTIKTEDELHQEWNHMFKESCLEIFPSDTGESFDIYFKNILNKLWSEVYKFVFFDKSSMLNQMDKYEKLGFPKEVNLMNVEEIIRIIKIKLTSDDPMDINNFVDLGIFLLEKIIRQKNEAVTEVLMDKGDPEFYYNLALKAYLEWDVTKAMSNLEKLFDLNKQHPNGKKLLLKMDKIANVFSKGNQAEKNLNFDKAITFYKKAMELDPLNKGLQFNNLRSIVMCFIKQKNYLRAIEHATKQTEYVKYDLELLPIYLIRAKCCKLLKRWQEAINDYELIKKISPAMVYEELIEDAKFRLNRKDYYGFLGLDSSASMELIHKSYEKLENKHRSNQLTTDDDRLAQDKIFKEISEAFSILSDPSKRERYDRIPSVAGKEQSVHEIDLLNSISPSVNDVLWAYNVD